MRYIQNRKIITVKEIKKQELNTRIIWQYPLFRIAKQALLSSQTACFTMRNRLYHKTLTVNML